MGHPAGAVDFERPASPVSLSLGATDSAELPGIETFKVLKRQLAAQGTDCADPVWEIQRQITK